MPIKVGEELIRTAVEGSDANTAAWQGCARRDNSFLGASSSTCRAVQSQRTRGSVRSVGCSGSKLWILMHPTKIIGGEHGIFAICRFLLPGSRSWLVPNLETASFGPCYPKLNAVPHKDSNILSSTLVQSCDVPLKIESGKERVVSQVRAGAQLHLFNAVLGRNRSRTGRSKRPLRDIKAGAILVAFSPGYESYRASHSPVLTSDSQLVLLSRLPASWDAPNCCRPSSPCWLFSRTAAAYLPDRRKQVRLGCRLWHRRQSPCFLVGLLLTSVVIVTDTFWHGRHDRMERRVLHDAPGDVRHAFQGAGHHRGGNLPDLRPLRCQ